MLGVDGVVLAGLLVLVLLSYGFELFNFNLTIDEEIHGQRFDPEVWLAQRRWGVYILTRFLLPHSVVPVVPLFLGLVAHLAGVLLLLRSWRVTERTTQLAVGGVMLTVPTLAYVYTFSTLSFAIGVGILCTGLAVTLYDATAGPRRFVAAIPAAIAISLYQTFALALACAFLVWLARTDVERRRNTGRAIVDFALLGVAALAGYAVVQILLSALLRPPSSTYIDQFFDLGALRDPLEVTGDMMRAAIKVYRGAASVFVHTVWALPLLLGLVAASAVWTPGDGPRASLSVRRVIFMAVILGIPFAGGLLSSGSVGTRSLLAVPLALGGALAIAMPRTGGAGRVAVMLVGILLIQFAAANNALFGSSHLALERDRAFATRLIQEIEIAREAADIDAGLLEIVGTPELGRPPLVPIHETFGASFFEWEEGNVYRALAFMRTLGLTGMEGLPRDRRAQYFGVAQDMPSFPAPGSVMTVDNVVIVKLGPYTNQQIRAICEAASMEACP